MFGEATLEIPASGVIGASVTSGLSDALAMVFGRTAAYTLSEQGQSVIVTLSDGTKKVIGCEDTSGEIRIETLCYRSN